MASPMTYSKEGTQRNVNTRRFQKLSTGGDGRERRQLAGQLFMSDVSGRCPCSKTGGKNPLSIKYEIGTACSRLYRTRLDGGCRIRICALAPRHQYQAIPRDPRLRCGHALLHHARGIRANASWSGYIVEEDRFSVSRPGQIFDDSKESSTRD